MIRSHRFLSSLALLLSLGCLATGGPNTAAEEPPRPLRFEDLQWLVGQWKGEPPGGGVAEEFWSAPAAGAMMGAFRWTRDEKVIVYEFLLLEETEQGLVLRLRHFSKGSVAWEEKDAPLDFWAEQARADEKVAFRADTEKGWLRLVMYPEGEGGLVVVLEKESGASLEFHYKRRM